MMVMKKAFKKYELNVTGQTISATFNPARDQTIWIPLLNYWKQRYAIQNKPIVIYLAAPAGSGKSTLAAYIKHLSTTINYYPLLQVLPMDGFHHTNAYLSTHTTMRDGKTISLKSIKGAPESFDVTNLIQHIQSLKTNNPLPWPFYDRSIHEPVDNAIAIQGQILLIEGNYLLLNQSPWNQLKAYSDDTIFIQANPNQLKTRLIQRKAKGCHYRDAVSFYEFSDARNVATVLNHSLKARLTLKLLSDNDYMVVEPNDDVVES